MTNHPKEAWSLSHDLFKILLPLVQFGFKKGLSCNNAICCPAYSRVFQYTYRKPMFSWFVKGIWQTKFTCPLYQANKEEHSSPNSASVRKHDICLSHSQLC